MLKAFTAWFIDLVIRALKSVFELFNDLFVWVLDLVLSAIATLLNAIPAPAFLSQYSLSTLINQMPDSVLYFAGALQLGTAFTIIAAGFSFRMGRKLLTLGQW